MRSTDVACTRHGIALSAAPPSSSAVTGHAPPRPPAPGDPVTRRRPSPPVTAGPPTAPAPPAVSAADADARLHRHHLGRVQGRADGRGDAPKIIKVKGTIDPVAEGCAAFAAPGYDFDAYLEKYSPENWGLDTDLSGEPADSPEGLRAASAADQDKVDQGERPRQHHHRRRRQERRDQGRQPPDQGRRQRHRPQPHRRGPARLLPAVGPDRHRHRRLELRVRRGRRLRLHPCVDRPQHPHRRPLPRQHAADVLRPRSTSSTTVSSTSCAAPTT